MHQFGTAFLLVFLLATNALLAQQRIVGVVLDANTDEPLPSATVQIEGTTEGTITNAVGRFELGQVTMPTTLVVRYIGYASLRVSVDASTRQPLVIKLEPSAVLLDEVVVDGEDPAVGIMRRVIEAKQAWRADLTAMQAEVYTRFMLYRQEELVQVREQIDELYWRPEEGSREVIMAERIRPPRSGRFRYAGPTYVPNFYDDNVAIAEFELMGPTHPRALDVYRFTLGGYRQQDGQRVYDIYFAPKAALATTLIGRVAVLDSVYAVLEVQARPHPDNVWPAPINSANITFEQRFAPLGKNYWLPIDLRVEGRVQVGRLGAQHPEASYEQVSRLTRHVVNIPAADSIFTSGRRFLDHPLKEAQDFLFRWNPGLVPMTPKETEALLAMDPRMTIRRAFRPDGLLAGYTAVDVVEREEVVTEEEATRRRFGYRPGLWAYFNRVDGWFTGLRRSVTLGRNVVLSGGAGYAWHRKAVGVEGRLTYGWTTARGLWDGFVRLEGSEGTQPRGLSATYPELFTSLTTYGGYDAYYDFFNNRRGVLTVGTTWKPWQLGFAVGANIEQHDSAERNNDYEGWLRANEQRPNPSITPGDLRSLTAEVTIGEPISQTHLPGARGLQLTTEHSTPDVFGSSYDYTTLRVDAQYSFATFGSRRAWPAAFHMRLRAGTSRGTLPAQRFALLDAATGPFASFGSFRTRAQRPYEGDRHAALFWEHDFSTLPFEAFGLWPIARASVGLSIFGAHGRTWLTDRAEDPLTFIPQVTEGMHHELGIGLTSFFNLPLRLDATYRLDDPGWAFSVGMFRRF